MQIHELKSDHKHKSPKRVGRGGKRGTTSGKGQKGQKSRAGHRIRPAERDMIQQLPKLKGVKNKISKEFGTIVIKTSQLERFAENNKITTDILIKKGIIKNKRQPVKVLYDKDPKASFSLESIKISGKAKDAVTKAGGKVI